MLLEDSPAVRSHKVPEWLQPFKEGLSGEPPDSDNVLVGQTVVESKEKTSDEDEFRGRRVNRSPIYRRKTQEAIHTQASQLTSTKFSHIDRHPSTMQEPDARGAVFIHRKILEMS